MDDKAQLCQFYCCLTQGMTTIYKNMVGKHFEILSFSLPIISHKSFWVLDYKMSNARRNFKG